MNWFEEQHLVADQSRLWDVQISGAEAGAGRIYPTPVYDQNGDLRCRSCGSPVSRAMSAKGHGIASCSDSGCPSHGFEFVEGSYLVNPSRTR